MWFNKISLRKKIIVLALLPTLVACVIFAALVANSSHAASKMVRNNVSDFMVERTVKSLDHAYKSSVVAADFTADELRLDAKIAELDTTGKGGYELTGPPVPHALIADSNHLGGIVNFPAFNLAGEPIVMGRSERLQDIHRDNGIMTTLFERVNDTGDFVRIASTSPQGAPRLLPQQDQRQPRRSRTGPS